MNWNAELERYIERMELSKETKHYLHEKESICYGDGRTLYDFYFVKKKLKAT